MNNIVRISALSHRVILGNPQKTKDYLFKALSQLNDLNPDMIVLPSLSMCGASLGSFYGNRALTDGCASVIRDIAKKTVKSGAYIVVGIPVEVHGRVFQTSAVIHAGKLLGYVPSYEPCEGLYGAADCEPDGELISPDTLFGCGSMKFAVVDCDPRRLPVFASSQVNAGADIVINVSAIKATVGFIDECRDSAASFSKSMGVAVAVCNGNIGESCSDSLYRSFTGIFECGETLEFKVHDNSYFISTADVDADAVKSQRVRKSDFSHATICEHALRNREVLLRSVRRDPYVPSDAARAEKYLADCFELQVRALAGRLRNSSTQKVVVGCSGGIDSALALLVSSEALKKMHQPVTNLIAARMDCFDTKPDDTANGDALCSALGATIRRIQIAKACMQHFNDIGHKMSNKNATYDASQERERMQIMLDIATSENAIVVGTGDLSENALGFMCPGGDASADYNVNGCFTKGTVYRILEYAAEHIFSGEVSECIKKILAVPVSPLLLPLNEEGRKPESLTAVNRYDLYDFFLYYFVKYSMEPERIFRYALNAFKGDCTPEEIRNALLVFFKRFIEGQKLRRHVAESPDIGEISLTRLNYSFPPDAPLTCILSDVGNINI